jgi:hypothetical protein
VLVLVALEVTVGEEVAVPVKVLVGVAVTVKV